ncbi:unnamed protein product [Leptosia nina]|uniref:Uncharacterized protein n=1 Tax=Leptosia nina TaxID=320188 RepID=A0AAV1JT12_9NEOP
MKRRLPTVREDTHKCDSDVVVYLMVTATAVLSYVNSLNGDFVHDDIPAIVTNRDVTGGGLRQLFLDDFWGTPMVDPNSHKSYRPLTTLSFRCAVSLLLREHSLDRVRRNMEAREYDMTCKTLKIRGSAEN